MAQIKLPKYDVEGLADTMIALLDKWIGVFKFHKLLLRGKPVSSARIAAYLHLTQREVAGLIEGADLDRYGNVVGYGLSIVPTPHANRFQYLATE